MFIQFETLALLLDIEFRLLRSEEGVEVGTPTVAGAKVVGRICAHGRDKKVIVFKKKRRKNYQRKQGHRQEYTLIEIEEIKTSVTGGESGPQKGRRELKKRQG